MAIALFVLHLNLSWDLGNRELFYDANGNMTSDGTHSYTWDARNQLDLSGLWPGSVGNSEGVR